MPALSQHSKYQVHSMQNDINKEASNTESERLETVDVWLDKLLKQLADI